MTDLDALAVQVGRELFQDRGAPPSLMRSVAAGEHDDLAPVDGFILGARAMLAKLREMGLVVEPLSQGALDVINERRRQVEVEGYTPAHDDAHDRGELAGAAAAYAAYRSQVAPEIVMGDEIIATLWPWPGEGSYKPKGRYDDLKRSAAFLIAEMDRLNRLGGPGHD